jgi:serine/threonine protein kinase
MRAKIANFGFAKTGHNAVTTHILGTQGYIAPEYLVDDLVTTKMDMFAYGVVLLELVSGREGEGVPRPGEEAGGAGGGGGVNGRGTRTAELPSRSLAAVMSVARACLQRNPAKRPTMVDVAYTPSRADEYFADYSDELVLLRRINELML